MSQEWGRADAAGTWPRPKPIWTLALLLAAIVSGAAVGAYRYTTAWTPLQRLFLSPYLRSDLASALAFKSGRYRLLHVIDRKGSRLPLDEEVQPLTTATDETAFALSDLGVQVGGSAADVAGAVVRSLAVACRVTRMDLSRSDAERLGDAGAVGKSGRVRSRPGRRHPKGHRAGS